MSEAPVLVEHHGPYTIADLEAMPDDSQRYELIDGALHVSPSPMRLHQRAAHRLCAQLNAAADDLEAVEALGVRCGEDTVLVPDVVVLSAAEPEPVAKVADAWEVALVVEVVSPSSGRMDRVLKPRLYADARIPAYLLVDTMQPTVTWFGLSASGAYEVRGVASGDEVLRVTEPFEVRIVPADLVQEKG